MAGINIRELYFRVTSRPDIVPASVRSALMDAGIQVCRETNLLRGSTLATLPAGKDQISIPLPSDQSLVRVNQVRMRTGGVWWNLGEIAPVYLEHQRVLPANGTEREPLRWGLRGGTLFFQAPADKAYPLRIDYTWAPTRASQPEFFDLPDDAEEAMVAYARWILLQDRDPRAAAEARRNYDAALPGLRAMGETGESGTRSIFDFLPFEG